MQIEKNVPLSPLTTFHIGGLARFFVRVESIDDLRDSLEFARNQNVSALILGGGSNVLVSDNGFAGLVIKIEIKGIEWRESGEGMLLIAGAGEVWDDIVLEAVEKDQWGIENLSGIPGTVGGAVVQGIGAYGQAVGQHLAWVEVFDTHSQDVRTLSVGECAFTYRGSIFKQEDGRYVVLRAAFLLSNVAQPDISYKDLTERFAGTTPSLEALRKAVLAIRAQKFPDLAVEGTAGSFFKNPILDRNAAKMLQDQYPAMPVFALPEAAGVKIPLAWLLDHVLQLKSFFHGGARLFERQPLVIVAKKSTPASDVEELARIVVKKVKEKFNIDIEPEVKIIK